MFIKISDSPERYINTDNVEVVSFGRLMRSQGGGQQRAACTLDFRSGRTIPISEAAGRVLIEFTEGNSAFLEDNTTPGVISTERATPVGGNEAPIKSKLAVFLRDEAPHGAMIMDLVMKFPGRDSEIPVALDELQEEKVVTLVEDRYYHATNAPREQPAIAVEGF